MLTISLLGNVLQTLAIISLVNQRHVLDQKLAAFEWAAITKYKEG
jgi:hypothetical protein